jgi:hypothetical protein
VVVVVVVVVHGPLAPMLAFSGLGVDARAFCTMGMFS